MSVESIIQKAVAHLPDCDLLFRARAQFALYTVNSVSDGHSLDVPSAKTLKDHEAERRELPIPVSGYAGGDEMQLVHAPIPIREVQ